MVVMAQPHSTETIEDPTIPARIRALENVEDVCIHRFLTLQPSTFTLTLTRPHHLSFIRKSYFRWKLQLMQFEN
jgi:hypothetical protein